MTNPIFLNIQDLFRILIRFRELSFQIGCEILRREPTTIEILRVATEIREVRDECLALLRKRNLTEIHFGDLEYVPPQEFLEELLKEWSVRSANGAAEILRAAEMAPRLAPVAAPLLGTTSQSPEVHRTLLKRFPKYAKLSGLFMLNFNDRTLEDLMLILELSDSSLTQECGNLLAVEAPLGGRRFFIAALKHADKTHVHVAAEKLLEGDLSGNVLGAISLHAGSVLANAVSEKLRFEKRGSHFRSLVDSSADYRTIRTGLLKGLDPLSLGCVAVFFPEAREEAIARLAKLPTDQIPLKMLMSSIEVICLAPDQLQDALIESAPEDVLHKLLTRPTVRAKVAAHVVSTTPVPSLVQVIFKNQELGEPLLEALSSIPKRRREVAACLQSRFPFARVVEGLSPYPSTLRAQLLSEMETPEAFQFLLDNLDKEQTLPFFLSQAFRIRSERPGALAEVIERFGSNVVLNWIRENLEMNNGFGTALAVAYAPFVPGLGNWILQTADPSRTPEEFLFSLLEVEECNERAARLLYPRLKSTKRREQLVKRFPSIRQGDAG